MFQETVINKEDLTLFQKVLLTTDGTVTRLLELYTGEKIKVNKIEQKITVGKQFDVLQCSEKDPLLSRNILLRGSDKNYLYAESLFVFEKLSRSIQYKLLETDTPIGLLWEEERTEMYRKVIECKSEPCEIASPYFDSDPGSLMLSRTYLVFNRNQPFGMICEKFPISYFRD